MNLSACLLYCLLPCLGLVSGYKSVSEEVQGLKNGQKEIKSLLLEVLKELKDTNGTGSNAVKPLKWYGGGSSLLSVSKATAGDYIRFEVELSVSPKEEVFWILDSNILEVMDIEFGTSITRRKNSTLYAINAPVSSEFLMITTVSPENTVVRYELDIQAVDANSTISDPRSCQASIHSVNSTYADAYYRCTPDLDSKDYWYQQLGLYRKSEDDEVTYKHISENPYFNSFLNVTFERNSTSKATLVFGKELVDRTKTFLFLMSLLTLKTNTIVKSIYYAYFKDISPVKNDDEYGFMDYPRQKLEPLEGELLTVYCEAFGRNPPPVRVERNGETISEVDGVSIRHSRTSMFSSSYVTFRHVTKNVEGSYSCVGDGNVKKVFPLFKIGLKPKVRQFSWSPLYNGTDTDNRLVVEGSKGVNIKCYNPFDPAEIFPVETLQTTPLSEWTERLEVEISTPVEERFFSYLNCEATDKNGEYRFEHYF